MEGQDEMTAILAESYPSNIKRTFAGLSINGCMKMIEAYGNDGANMADTWTVFGDPTIAVRTDVPQPMTVSAGTLLFTGDSTFTVGCDTDSARVTLSAGDSVLATGLVQNHAIQLSFPPLISAGDTIKLVVTAYNRIPFIDSLQVLELQPVNAGFIGVPTSVIPGNNVCFTDTSTGTARSWQWICPGGTPGTSSQQNPVVTYNERGTYDVTLIVGNGASFDTIVKTGYITADWPAGWDAKSSGLGITVTPNPNQGESTIMIPGSGDSPVLIRVTDLVGKTVYSQKFIPSGGKLHLSLPPSVKGNLIFEIQSAQGTFREKVSIY
jgi:PKD repeat protein